METNEIIGRNLRLLMEENEMSLREFARRMNIAPATASQWCTGKKVPRLKRIDEICAIFHISRDDLVTPLAVEGYRESIIDREGTELFKSLEYEMKMKIVSYMKTLK